MSLCPHLSVWMKSSSSDGPRAIFVSRESKSKPVLKSHMVKKGRAKRDQVICIELRILLSYLCFNSFH